MQRLPVLRESLYKRYLKKSYEKLLIYISALQEASLTVSLSMSPELIHVFQYTSLHFLYLSKHFTAESSLQQDILLDNSAIYSSAVSDLYPRLLKSEIIHQILSAASSYSEHASNLKSRKRGRTMLYYQILYHDLIPIPQVIRCKLASANPLL